MTDIPGNLDERNIKEQFKGQSQQQIEDFLYDTQYPMIFMFVNVNGDFNKSTGVRNASFFNFEKVAIYGKRKWDRRGAVGANKYIPVVSVESDWLDNWLARQRDRGYRIVALENNIDYTTIDLQYYDFAEKTVVIFGEEGSGLTNDILDQVDDIVEIVGLGPMRSLNVGTASGIIAYEYTRQQRSLNGHY